MIEKIIRERIYIDDIQFGFMPGRGTTDAIFILRQLQEKHLAKNKKLYFTFDLVISAETEEGLKMKLNKWKTEMEAKGLRVNMGKTKIMVSGVNLQT